MMRGSAWVDTGRCRASRLGTATAAARLASDVHGHSVVRIGTAADHDRPARRDQDVPAPGPERDRGSTGAGSRPARPQTDQARVVAYRLAAAGKPVSRRALRSGGVKGSNQALNAL